MHEHCSIAVDQLATPARYLPWLRQRDLLSAGLYRFGHDFGNASADQRLFQLDQDFAHYRDNIIQARKQLHKYYCHSQRPPTTDRAVNSFIVEQLCREYPQWFFVKDNSLHCRLTGETLLLDNPSGYSDLFDALASQLQEDIAVMQFDIQGNNRLCALHLCCPNHWGANQRVGESFYELHKAVPGLNEAISDADKLLNSIIQRGPYVRFVWGLSNSRELDMHPEKQLTRKALDMHKDLFVRVERQVLYGLPQVNALLFIIRTYFVAVNELSKNERSALWQKIQSADDDLLAYKGIQRHDFQDFK
jgi:hypothetical protein